MASGGMTTPGTDVMGTQFSADEMHLLASSRSTTSSSCGKRSPIGSGRRDTPCTVMCIPAAGTGTRNGMSRCSTAEATASPTTLGGSTKDVSQAPPWEHSASVSAQ